MTPEDHEFIRTHAFTVPSPCGRAWEVPMRKVFQDYLRYRKEADNEGSAIVEEGLTVDDLTSWFYDQYSWDDVERDGRQVRQPTPRQIQDALDLMRSRNDPSREATLAPSPLETARLGRAKLRQQVSQSRASGAAPKPKM